MPAFQATVFNVTLGHEPTGLKIGVVNDELNPSQGRICNYSTDCSYSMLSCRYLRYIKDNIIQVLESAVLFRWFFITYILEFEITFFYVLHDCRSHTRMYQKPWMRVKMDESGV